MGRATASHISTMLLVTAFLGSGISTSAAHAAKGESLGLTVAMGGLYDSNFLQYSDGQLTDFESGLHPARFSVRTTDDLVLLPSVALTGELDEGRGRRHSLRLRYEGAFHDRNATADMRSWSATWRESFHHDRQFSLGYYWLPRFYLRQLLAEDWTAVPASVRYRRAEFSLGIATATYSQRVGGAFAVDADYQRERRGYNPDFVERSSNLNQERLALAYDGLGRRGSLRGYGGYRESKARGVDGDEIVGQPSDDSDVGYKGAIAGSNLRYEFARSRRWRWAGDLGYEFEARNFTSAVLADKYHYGRHDRLQAIEAGLRSALRPHLSARGFYRHETNIAHLGSSAPLSTDAGSYHVHQFGLSLEWNGDLLATRH